METTTYSAFVPDLAQANIQQCQRDARAARTAAKVAHAAMLQARDARARRREARAIARANTAHQLAVRAFERLTEFLGQSHRTS